MEYLEEFKSYLENEDKSTLTIRSYLTGILQFQNWLEETYNISDISIIATREIKNYRSILLEKYSPASVNQKLATIKTFFNFLYETNTINENPAQKVKMQVIEDNFQHQYLTRTEELTILKIAREKDIKTYCIVLLMLKTGARVSEVSNLKLGDLLLNKNEPTILIKNSKGQKSRYIPIPQDVVTALIEWIEVRNKSNKIYHLRSQYVFTSQRNDRLQPRAIQKILSNIGTVAGIKLYPIRLRASYANNLLQYSNIPINILASLMGHSNINTTGRYAKASMHDKRKYIETLSEI
ncbi:tyrosine-type recombinase/integrase [Lysinibacillus telephonicus]|uniref:tyrosine-type recombinase/integrase n=1 Tax=Lysinibacillus telephonicus TaxID=1714840 RepID=UPI00397A49EB